jgi:hypothetical protein
VTRTALLLLAVALALGGCGSGSGTDDEPRPGVAASLDADNLAMVHDELYACLRGALPHVLLANYLNGHASISDVYARSTFDDALAAPVAERALLEAGRAEFIGVRANRSLVGWRRVPEWDLLILPTSADAEQAAAMLEGAAQNGIFVRLVKRAGGGGRARAAEAALTRCLDASRRG